MKTIFTIFIGTESDKDGNYIPKLVSHHAIEAIQREAGLMFDGYTMGFVIGGWNDNNGHPVKEHSIRLEIVANSDRTESVRVLARFAKDLLKQNCVMVLQQAIHFEMI
jgi:hypothetical protein